MDIGLSLTEIETMPYLKFFRILKGHRAVKAEQSMEELRIATAPKMLESKKTSQNYTNLFKSFEKTLKFYGHKEVTVKADLSLLARLKN